MIEAAAKLAGWRDHPVAFVRECFGAEPDAWQVEVLEAVAKNQRVALKASKGPGKTCLLAWVAWWFLITRPHPKVIATSITGDNLADGLWAELALWQSKSPLLKAAFTWSAESIVAKDHPATWFASARTWSRSASPEQQADTLAGIHADSVLFLVDEAGGIPDAVVAAAEGGLANVSQAAGREAKLLLAGNPTMLSGPLYRACTRERHLWWVKEISGDPDDPMRAPRVSAQWAREQIDKYGRDSPYVLVNVFGQFPPAQSNALIGLEDATKASRRTLAEADYTYAPRVMGVDVAFEGDDRTVFAFRQGRAAFRMKVFRNLKPMEIAGQLVLAIEKWKPAAVFVDCTGGYGGGVVDRLHELGYASVIGVNFASKAPDSTSKNMRVYMWDQMARWVQEGSIPEDSELISEMCAPTYWLGSDGRKHLLSKADMKSDGLPSPDKADALALTFAAPVAIKTALDRAREDARGRRGHDYDPYEERA